MAASAQDGPIPVAVITGHHAFDVPGFHGLLRSLPGVDSYPQHMEDFAASDDSVRQGYEALVFYNYHQVTPGEAGGKADDRMRRALECLGESEQGIVLLHHALVAFPRWTKWAEICGIRNRSFKTHRDQSFHVAVAQQAHPVTEGISSWDMVDETYQMASAGEACEILLRTNHPKSMETLAWTREFGRARVFCYQSGHDRRAYEDPNVRAALAQGITWVSRRI